MSTPANAPTLRAHAPAQLNTADVEISPAVVRTDCTRPACWTMPSTSTPSMNLTPQPPRSSGVCQRDRMGAGDPVAGAERAAQDVVALDQRSELAHLAALEPAGIGHTGLMPHQ